MSKLVWKRTAKGNVMLTFRNLRAVVFPVRCPAHYGTPDYILYSYNILGLPSGTVWGPRFRLEADAGNAAVAELARHCPMLDFQHYEEFQREFLVGVTREELQAGISGLERQVTSMQKNLDNGESAGDDNRIRHNIEEVRHNIRSLQHSLKMKEVEHCDSK